MYSTIISQQNLDGIEVAPQKDGLDQRPELSRGHYVIVKGHIRYINGNGGYLSTDVAGLKNLYAFLVIIYGILTLFWSLQLGCKKKHVTRLHIFLNFCVNIMFL